MYGSNTYVIYYDFSKTFNRVDHKIVLKKLSKTGIRGKLLHCKKVLLTNRTQHLVFEGTSSCLANVSSGVPQGAVLGLHLFFIDINDLVGAIKHFTLNIFADDYKFQKAINGMGDRKCLVLDLFADVQYTENINRILND